MGVVRRREEKVVERSGCYIFCSNVEYETTTTPVPKTGIPLNAQFFFTPIRFAGIGFETGFTVMLPEAKPAFDLSVQLIVRVPR